MWKEIWKPVVGNAYYKISNLWRIKSIERTVNCKLGSSRIKKESMLSPSKSSSWYHMVWFKNWKWTRLVNRIEAIAFFWESELQVNHKNGIKTDNRLENLEYVTPHENSIHAVRLWLMRYNSYMKWKFGSDNHVSVPVKATIKWIETVFCSIRQAHKDTWVNYNSISQCCLWNRRTAGWYVWSYAK